MTERDKREMLKIKIKQIEEKAKLDEQLDGVNDLGSIEKMMAAGDLYAESLKMKLSVLRGDF